MFSSSGAGGNLRGFYIILISLSVNSINVERVSLFKVGILLVYYLREDSAGIKVAAVVVPRSDFRDSFDFVRDGPVIHI